MFRSRPAHISFLFALLGMPLSPASHAADSKNTTTIDWVPGMTFALQRVTAVAGVPTPTVVTTDLAVTKSDGTPRTYLTLPGQTATAWQPGLPVYQGDHLRLTVLVATGGAELQTLIVRLDNKPLTVPSSGPWAFDIDTQMLSQGVHFLEAWAKTGMNTPTKTNSSDSTLAFTIAAPGTGGDQPAPPPVLIPTPPGIPLPVPPPDPAAILALSPALKGQPSDPNAIVALHLRTSEEEGDKVIGPVNGTLDLSRRVVLSVDKTPGTTAVRYWYAVVRGSITASISEGLLDPQVDRIKLFQFDNATKQGLFPGQVTLYVWGIDKDNHPGDPVTVPITIPGNAVG